jgi:Transmembrane secretion effector
MAVAPNVWIFLPIAALAGLSWTVSASELWIAGQRAMPDWARGPMNAVHMMVSQGGVALGEFVPMVGPVLVSVPALFVAFSMGVDKFGLAYGCGAAARTRNSF